MRSRTEAEERRSAIRWFVITAFVLAAMVGMWWLVVNTNKEGEHDAELLPYFALIPFVIAVYHSVRARARHA